jgi:translocation and assembly module TamB
MAIQGSTRLQGYDIEAQVTGTPEAPEVQLTSSPALPSDELLLLLLTGQRPASGGSGVEDRQAAESIAVYLAQDFLTRWLRRGNDDDVTWAERFEFVRGRDVSQNGVETAEATFLLRERKGSGERREAVYLVAEQDSFEDKNYGVRWVFRFQ